MRDVHVCRCVSVMMRLPAGTEAVPQVKMRRETTPMVSLLTDDMSSCVATVGLTVDGSDRPAELLDFYQDCCFMNVGVLAPEWSPDVSARGAAVPTPLPTIAEVFSFPEDVEKLSSCAVVRLRGRVPRDTITRIRGRLGLYKSGRRGRIAIWCPTSDWVTSLQTCQRTCSKCTNSSICMRWDYTLLLDHSVLVRSDICHLGYHGDTWDYV